MGGIPETAAMISAVSSVAGAGLSMAGQATQQSALRQQQNLQKSRDALQLAEQEKQREKELAQTLARQNAWFAASGTDASSGSALSVTNAAMADAQDDLSLIATGGALADQTRALNGAVGNASLTRSLLSSGLGAANTLAQLKWK